MSEIIDTQKDIENRMLFVQQLRKDRHLSQKEMARILGVGVGTVRKIERGIFPERISCPVLVNIYREFGIKPSEQFR